MNREIKFRGKLISTGEWIYGSLMNDAHVVCSIVIDVSNFCVDYNARGSEKYYEVDPKTVGQYIGLEDKNKKEIYEWDILKNTISKDMFYIEWGKKHDYCGWVTVLIRNNERNLFLSRNFKNSEIIGNIHDNPELLEKQND